MIQEKSCGCIIIKDNKVLLVQENAGHWGFPKGHVEDGETEVKTALREVKEETNLDVTLLDGKRYTVEYVTDKGNLKQVVFFIALNIVGEMKPQESEIQRIEWVDLEKANDIITHDNLKELLKKVLQDIDK